MQIYDFRRDIRHVLVTPSIRSRFMRLEPGAPAGRHSHDLGHEIFLVLQGRALFEIDGEEAELGPGQMCIALADQPHQVGAVGDEPMIMYLSVTPHIQPTHTGRTGTGEREPIRFAPSSSYEVETDTETPIEALIDRHIEAAQTLARAARENARTQQEQAVRLKQALAAGDEEGAAEMRNTMWEALYQTFVQIYDQAEVWNDLAPRVAPTG